MTLVPEIVENEIRGRALEVAIPKGATPSQIDAIRQAEVYGKNIGVDVKVIVIE